MDENSVSEQLKKIESKTEPWLDWQLTRLVAYPWTLRIVLVVVAVLLTVLVIV